MMIFVILGGSSKHTPITQFYWLEADTSNIPGAYGTSAWLFWGVCDKNDWSNCIQGPAFALSPKDNFKTEENVPEDFISKRNAYFYLSRFAFAFCLITFCFVCFTFLTHLAQFCFTRGDKYNTFLLSLALFFGAGWVSFQTAVVIMARDAFNGADRSHKVPVKTMAMMWTSFFLILLLFISSVSLTVSASFKNHLDNVKEGNNNQYYQQPAGAPAHDNLSFTRANAPELKEDNGGIRFFKIKRNPKTEADDESV